MNAPTIDIGELRTSIGRQTQNSDEVSERLIAELRATLEPFIFNDSSAAAPLCPIFAASIERRLKPPTVSIVPSNLAAIRASTSTLPGSTNGRFHDSFLALGELPLGLWDCQQFAFRR